MRVHVRKLKNFLQARTKVVVMGAQTPTPVWGVFPIPGEGAFHYNKHANRFSAATQGGAALFFGRLNLTY